jgi:hypothetical protein
MQAEMIVLASTLEEARAKAAKDFEAFFGVSDWRIWDEKAEARWLDSSSARGVESFVTGWRVTFTAGIG